MEQDNPVMRILWPLLASLAGAVTALSFRPFKKMGRTEIVIALVVGTSFATFVGPLVAKWMFGAGPVDISLLGGAYYLLASGSNILIPLAVKKVGSFFGVAAGEIEP